MQAANEDAFNMLALDIAGLRLGGRERVCRGGERAARWQEGCGGTEHAERA